MREKGKRGGDVFTFTCFFFMYRRGVGGNLVNLSLIILIILLRL
jgi:hypothetical protein